MSKLSERILENLSFDNLDEEENVDSNTTTSPLAEYLKDYDLFETSDSASLTPQPPEDTAFTDLESKRFVPQGLPPAVAQQKSFISDTSTVDTPYQIEELKEDYPILDGTVAAIRAEKIKELSGEKTDFLSTPPTQADFSQLLDPNVQRHVGTDIPLPPPTDKIYDKAKSQEEKEIIYNTYKFSPQSFTNPIDRVLSYRDETGKSRIVPPPTAGTMLSIPYYSLTRTAPKGINDLANAFADAMAFGVTFGNFTFEELRDDKFDFATYDTADQFVESTLNEGVAALPGYGLIQKFAIGLFPKLFNGATYKEIIKYSTREGGGVSTMPSDTETFLFGKAENRSPIYDVHPDTPLLALDIEADNEEEFIRILDHRKNMLVDAIAVGGAAEGVLKGGIKGGAFLFDKIIRPFRDYVGYGFGTGQKYDPDNPITDKRKVNQAQRLLEAIVGFKPLARDEGLLTDQRIVDENYAGKIDQIARILDSEYSELKADAPDLEFQIGKINPLTTGDPLNSSYKLNSLALLYKVFNDARSSDAQRDAFVQKFGQISDKDLDQYYANVRSLYADFRADPKLMTNLPKAQALISNESAAAYGAMEQGVRKARQGVSRTEEAEKIFDPARDLLGDQGVRDIKAIRNLPSGVETELDNLATELAKDFSEGDHLFGDTEKLLRKYGDITGENLQVSSGQELAVAVGKIYKDMTALKNQKYKEVSGGEVDYGKLYDFITEKTKEYDPQLLKEGVQGAFKQSNILSKLVDQVRMPTTTPNAADTDATDALLDELILNIPLAPTTPTTSSASTSVSAEDVARNDFIKWAEDYSRENTPIDYGFLYTQLRPVLAEKRSIAYNIMRPTGGSAGMVDTKDARAIYNLARDFISYIDEEALADITDPALIGKQQEAVRYYKEDYIPFFRSSAEGSSTLEKVADEVELASKNIPLEDASTFKTEAAKILLGDLTNPQNRLYTENLLNLVNLKGQGKQAESQISAIVAGDIITKLKTNTDVDFSSPEQLKDFFRNLKSAQQIKNPTLKNIQTLQKNFPSVYKKLEEYFSRLSKGIEKKNVLEIKLAEIQKEVQQKEDEFLNGVLGNFIKGKKEGITPYKDTYTDGYSLIKKVFNEAATSKSSARQLRKILDDMRKSPEQALLERALKGAYGKWVYEKAATKSVGTSKIPALSQNFVDSVRTTDFSPASDPDMTQEGLKSATWPIVGRIIYRNHPEYIDLLEELVRYADDMQNVDKGIKPTLNSNTADRLEAIKAVRSFVVLTQGVLTRRGAIMNALGLNIIDKVDPKDFLSPLDLMLSNPDVFAEAARKVANNQRLERGVLLQALTRVGLYDTDEQGELEKDLKDAAFESTRTVASTTDESSFLDDVGLQSQQADAILRATQDLVDSIDFLQ